MQNIQVTLDEAFYTRNKALSRNRSPRGEERRRGLLDISNSTILARPMAFPPSSSHDWSRCNNIISISGHSILLIINRQLISRIWPCAFRSHHPDRSSPPPFTTLLRHRVTLGSSRTSGYAECFENAYPHIPPAFPLFSSVYSINVHRAFDMISRRAI